MTAGPSRAIGYVRVSKAREEMISPELQVTAIRDYCERSKCLLIDVVHDLDATGRNFARAGIQSVIERVEAGEAERVVVWKWSRFGRNVRDCLVNIDRLEVAGGRLIAATEDFDDTPVGRFGRGQFLLMAQFESERIGEQWKEAKSRRVSMGLPGDGHPRFGYTYSRETGFIIDPQLQPIVEGMYRDYVAGRSFQQIADELNAAGVPTPRGSWWRATSVTQILDTGFAAGLLRLSPRSDVSWVRGAHDPIIDGDLWDAYQRARRLRAGVSSRAKEATWPYSGLAVCGHCGSTLIRAGRHGNVRCSAHKKRVDCPSPTFTLWERLDAPVRDFLTTISNHINRRTKSLQRPRQSRTAAQQEVTRLTREITRLTTALNRVTRQHVDGVVPLDAYTATRDSIVSERAALEATLLQLQDSNAAPADLDPNLLRDWDSLPTKTQRDILHRLIHRIVVTGHGRGNPPTITIEPRWETVMEKGD